MRRRSGRRAVVLRATRDIRQGWRASTWLEPPSPDATRSGFSRASAARAAWRKLREVSADAPLARATPASGRNQPGGTS